MSQDASTQQTVLDPQVDSPTLGESAVQGEETDFDMIPQAPTFSAENYADSLMNELFEDVDRMLESGVKLPTETAEPEYVALEPVSIPQTISQMILPSVFLPRRPLDSEETDSALDTLTSAQLETLEPLPDRQSGDRLLLGAALLSIFATAALWFALQGRWQQGTAPVADAPLTTEQLQAQDDRNFLNYMEDSLAQIDRQAEENSRMAGGSSTSDLPPVAVAGNNSSSSQAPNVIERVYIPIYQPPQLLAPPPAAPAPAPTAPPTVAAAPAAPAPAPATSDADAPNIATSATHVLVGLLELGDRSAALFEIDGSTQRIYVGENIGSSGWTLVSVANQEAIVRRNGEVRSIYVGQQF